MRKLILAIAIGLLLSAEAEATTRYEFHPWITVRTTFGRWFDGDTAAGGIAANLTGGGILTENPLTTGLAR